MHKDVWRPGSAWTCRGGLTDTLAGFKEAASRQERTGKGGQGLREWTKRERVGIISNQFLDPALVQSAGGYAQLERISYNM